MCGPGLCKLYIGEKERWTAVNGDVALIGISEYLDDSEKLEGEIFLALCAGRNEHGMGVEKRETQTKKKKKKVREV